MIVPPAFETIERGPLPTDERTIAPMQTRYATPYELIEALHRRAPGAREQLGAWLRPPLDRLLDSVVVRNGLRHDRGRLLLRTLHTVETYLRTRPADEFRPASVPAFVAAVLLHVGKMFRQPFGHRPGPSAGPEPLADCDDYACRSAFLPFERVGEHWFGGDWFGGARSGDGARWVLVADVTGHGWGAYLLACHLPDVWRLCWERAGSPSPQPLDLLRDLHRVLADCLPEGVYVEGTLARLRPDGTVTVAPAGGSRLLVRGGPGRMVSLRKLRGAWLGLSVPVADEYQTWTLAEGEELAIGTDGLFDQLAFEGGADALARLAEGAGDDGSLFDLVEGALRRALERHPQTDDITLVTLSRRGRPAAPGAR